ncbi:hypothetical protein C8R47DRAFT_1083549 [Mycena vitilis]|nr:hypothetical protein C8R47DRAFT_1083549 [Mycena vitilis]
MGVSCKEQASSMVKSDPTNRIRSFDGVREWGTKIESKVSRNQLKLKKAYRPPILYGVSSMAGAGMIDGNEWRGSGTSSPPIFDASVKALMGLVLIILSWTATACPSKPNLALGLAQPPIRIYVRQTLSVERRRRFFEVFELEHFWKKVQPDFLESCSNWKFEKRDLRLVNLNIEHFGESSRFL